MKNRYEIHGEVTAIFLNLRNGQTITTTIETVDLPLLLKSEYTWTASYSRFTNSYYVNGYGIKRNGKQKKVKLHRFLMGDPKCLLVDHINHDTLDNRRSNLRLVTVSQNLQNRKGPPSHNTSGFRGVSFDKEHNKYRAYIRINNKLKHLGRFDSAVEAAKVASAARRKFMPYASEARQIGD